MGLNCNQVTRYGSDEQRKSGVKNNIHERGEKNHKLWVWKTWSRWVSIHEGTTE
jgi:hypothetical protein